MAQPTGECGRHGPYWGPDCPGCRARDDLDGWTPEEIAEELDEHGQDLTPWEIEFVASSLPRARAGRLSDKSLAKLEQIAGQRLERFQ